jgi:hypothetical protein
MADTDGKFDTVFLPGPVGAALVTYIAAALSKYDQRFNQMPDAAKILAIHRTIFAFTVSNVDAALFESVKHDIEYPVVIGFTLRPNVRKYAEKLKFAHGFAIFSPALQYRYGPSLSDGAQALRHYASSMSDILSAAIAIGDYIRLTRGSLGLQDNMIITRDSLRRYIENADPNVVARTFGTWQFRMKKGKTLKKITDVECLDIKEVNLDGFLVSTYSDCYDQIRHDEASGIVAERRFKAIGRVPGLVEPNEPQLVRFQHTDTIALTLNFRVNNYDVAYDEFKAEYNRKIDLASKEVQRKYGAMCKLGQVVVQRIKAGTDPTGNATANRTLRLQRANSVATAFAKMNIPREPNCIAVGDQESVTVARAEYAQRMRKSEAPSNRELYAFMRRVDVKVVMTFTVEDYYIEGLDDDTATVASEQVAPQEVVNKSMDAAPLRANSFYSTPSFQGKEYTTDADVLKLVSHDLIASSKAASPPESENRRVMAAILDAAAAVYPLWTGVNDAPAEIRSEVAALDLKMETRSDCTGWALPLAEACIEAQAGAPSHRASTFSRVIKQGNSQLLKKSFTDRYAGKADGIKGLANRFLVSRSGSRLNTVDTELDVIDQAGIYLACMTNASGSLSSGSGHVAIVFYSKTMEAWLGLHLATGYNKAVQAAKGSITLHVFFYKDSSGDKRVLTKTKFGGRTERLIRLL